MAPSWLTVERVIAFVFTPIFLKGAEMLVGVCAPQLVPAKDLEEFHEVASIFSKASGLDLDPQAFSLFFGNCQVFGVLALHGLLGQFLATTANCCFLVHLSGAVYVHIAKGENIAPAAAFLALAAGRLFYVLFIKMPAAPSAAGKRD
mmetsp:Transcript_70013/g.167969  ORF Transcript_70013/g.167969 Transcript_70013/m.167969 type:complete len:147 (+) Transcript_70013:107-547(+)